MGFTDGVSNFFGGLWNAGTSTVGLIGDVVTADWNDDDDRDQAADGFVGMLTQRAAEFGQGLFGQTEEGQGRGLAAVPGVTGALQGLETAGREFIREPLATAVTAATGEGAEEFGAVADVPIVGGALSGVAALVTGRVGVDDIKRAHDIAQTRSLGQSVVVGLAGRNAWDKDDVLELMNTSYFNLASGAVDAFMRFKFDPDVLIGHGLARGRRSVLTRPLLRGEGPAKNLDDFFTEGGLLAGPVRARFRDVDSFVKRMLDEADDTAEAAGRIRDRLFEKADPFGDFKASLLARAPDSTARAQTARFLMGDLKEYHRVDAAYQAKRAEVERLQAGRPALTDVDEVALEGVSLSPEQIRRARLDKQNLGVMRDQMRASIYETAGVQRHPDGWISDLVEMEFRNDVDALSSLDDQISLATRELDWVKKVRDEAFATQANELRVGVLGDVRDSIVRTDFWQNSRLTRPLRIFGEMRNHNFVRFDDPDDAAEQVARMMVGARAPKAAVERWRGRMADATPGQRFELWLEAESEAVKSIMDDFGVRLSRDDVNNLVGKMRQGRKQAQGITGNRAFLAEGEDFMRWSDEAGEIHVAPRPLAGTQIVNGVQTTDMHQIRQAIFRYAREGLLPTSKKLDETPARVPPDTLGSRTARGLTEVGRLPKEAMEGLSYYWKASVLLRPGWTARVVLMDEQLRSIAKFGAMVTLGQSGKKFRNLTAGLVDQLGLKEADGVRRVANRTGIATGAVTGLLAGGPFGAVAGGAIGRAAATAVSGTDVAAAVSRRLEGLTEAGYVVNVNGHKFSPFDKDDLYRDQLSQQLDVDAFLRPNESRVYETMRGEWGTVTGEMPNHRQAWKRVMGRQVAQDPLWRQALDPDGSPQDMLAWLSTPEGKRYLQNVPWRTDEAKEVWHAGRWVDATPELHVQQLWDEARRLVGDDPELARRIHETIQAGDDVAPVLDDVYKQLVSNKGNASLMPKVHGELAAQMSGQSKIMKTIDDLIQSGFRFLGGLPTDTLSRQPAFASFFEQNMKRLMDTVGEDNITKTMLDSFENQSRQFALKQTKNLMYELAERSAFDDLVRLFIPFAPAGREVLTRWAGIAAENPAVLARARQAWQAPDKLGLVEEDEDGNEWISMRLPEFAKGLVQHTPLIRNAVDSQGFVRFPKGAFSTVPMFGDSAATAAAQGLFGFGPVVQLAAGRLVEERPELEEAARFILPFGIPKDAPDAFLPAWLKRARGLGLIPGIDGGVEDRSFRSIFFNIMKTKITDMRTGQREPVDFDDETSRAEFLAEVRKEARDLQKLRMFSSFLAPVAPSWESPYKPYIDEYRRLRDNEDAINEARRQRGLEPMDAEGIFYAMHGRDFSALVQSTTENNTGIPATLEGFQVQNEHKDFLERHPELGGLVVGLEGGGTNTKFSAAVYQRQLGEETFPGSGTMQREPLSPDEFLTETDARQGWDKFSRVMDAIESQRINRGLPNLQVKAAEDLARKKRRLVEFIGQQHPAWVEQRNSLDTDRWRERIGAIRELVDLPDLDKRKDVQRLKQYLQMRDQMISRLVQRDRAGGAKTLRAASNQDLALQWETAVSQLIADSPSFASLYYRWLEGDPLSIDTLPTQEAA